MFRIHSDGQVVLCTDKVAFRTVLEHLQELMVDPMYKTTDRQLQDMRAEHFAKIAEIAKEKLVDLLASDHLVALTRDGREPFKLVLRTQQVKVLQVNVTVIGAMDAVLLLTYQDAVTRQEEEANSIDLVIRLEAKAYFEADQGQPKEKFE